MDGREVRSRALDTPSAEGVLDLEQYTESIEAATGFCGRSRSLPRRSVYKGSRGRHKGRRNPAQHCSAILNIALRRVQSCLHRGRRDMPCQAVLLYHMTTPLYRTLSDVVQEQRSHHRYRAGQGTGFTASEQG